MHTKAIAPVTAGVLLALAGSAQAATKTASFTVSATVTTNCVISAADLNLGSFDGTNDLASTSDITVLCTSGTPYSVALNAGAGSYVLRTMSNGSDTLAYNLYTTGGYTTVWGDDSGATDVVGGNGAGMAAANAITHTVYGQLLASDNTGAVGAGVYSDLITATITY